MKKYALFICLFCVFSSHAQVQIFKDENYGGDAVRLMQGTHFPYSSFGFIGNDAITSIKVAKGYIAILFEDNGKNAPAGKYVVVKGSVTNLAYYGDADWNDKTSYIIILPDVANSVIVFTDSLLKGSKSYYQPGKQWLFETERRNISSVFVPEGLSVGLSVADPDLPWENGSPSAQFAPGVHFSLPARLDNNANYIKVTRTAPALLESAPNARLITECCSAVNWTGSYVHIDGRFSFYQYADIRGEIKGFSAGMKVTRPENIPTGNVGNVSLEIYEVPSQKLLLKTLKPLSSILDNAYFDGMLKFDFEPFYTSAAGIKIVITDEHDILSWKYVNDATPLGYSSLQNGEDFVFCINYKPLRGSWVPEWYKQGTYRFLGE